VTLIHVVGTDPTALRLKRDVYGFGPDEAVSVKRAQKAAEAKLRELADAELTGMSHEVVVLVGYDLASTILEEEPERAPSLIVMGTAGFGGFFHFVLGSAAETVARRAGCSVMIMRVGE
jgi:nucleotide-binding universal stress UspA family protein